MRACIYFFASFVVFVLHSIFHYFFSLFLFLFHTWACVLSLINFLSYLMIIFYVIKILYVFS